MFSIAWPWVFFILPLPFILRAMSPDIAAHSALRVPFYAQLKSTVEQNRYQRYRPRVRFILPTLIWLLLISAAVRPQWLDTQKILNTRGHNSILAVDLSASMLTRDLSENPNSRFAVTRELLLQLLDNRPNDRFGLIFFASQAYLQAPLTFDHNSLRHWLQTAEPGIAGDNTAIGDAIGLGIKRLRGLQASDKNLILFTDGANNSGIMPPRTAARFAALEGIRIHTLGIGKASDNSQEGPDQALLQDIAWRTGGRYLHVHSERSFHAAVEFINSLPASTEQNRAIWKTHELYRWPLAAALLLAAILGLSSLLRKHVRPAARSDHE